MNKDGERERERMNKTNETVAENSLVAMRWNDINYAYFRTLFFLYSMCCDTLCSGEAK